MEFTAEEIEEFKTEAFELLDESEKNLLALEKGSDFKKTYDAVFRVFHSLKGGAGMLGMQKVQSHMHQLETHYQQCKNLTTLSKDSISYFLRGVDVARQLLEGGNPTFEYSLPEPSISGSPQKTAPPAPATASSPVTATAPAPSSTPQLPTDTSKVFVIDDEKEIVEVLSEIIQDSGFQPIGFTNPVEAISKLKSEKPDLVLSDMKMPEMSGFDVLKQVQAFDSDLPVAFISGHISKEMVLDSINKGIYSVIEKPFSVTNVIGICQSAIERYKLVKLLNNTISFIYFNYSDLDQYLQAKGGETLREIMNSQFKTLIETRRKLKKLP